MEESIFPPSPSWFLPNIIAAKEDGSICYGSKNNIVILKSKKKTKLKILLIQGAHSSRVTAVAYPPPKANEAMQNTLVSSSEDGFVKLWYIDTLTATMGHKCHCEQEGDSKVVSLDWSTANSHFIVSVAENNTIILWDIFFNTTVKYSFQKLGATVISCCPYNDKVVAVGGKTGEVFVISLVESGNIIFKLRGHDNKIQSLSWCPIPYNIFKVDEIVEEFLLASGCQSKEIYIWRVGSDGKCQNKFQVPTTPLSSKGHHYGKVKNSFSYLTLSWLEPYKIYTSSSFGELIYLDFKALISNEQNEIQIGKGKFNKHASSFVKVAHNFHSKGLYAIAGLPVKSQVKLFGSMSIESELQFPIMSNNILIIKNSESEKSEFCWDVVLPEPSALVWTAGQDRKLICCEINSFDVKRVFYCHTLNGSAYCAVVSPQDPNIIAIGVGDGMIRLLNLTELKGDIQVFWQKIKDRVMSLDWHPIKDGLLAYGTSEGRVGLLDTTSNKLPNVFKPSHPHPIYSLSWGPEFYPNKTNSEPRTEFDLYSVGNNILSLYQLSKLNSDPLNLSKLIAFPCKHQTDVRWKPDYSVMAVGNEDGSICLVEPVKFNIVCTLIAYKKLIQSISWHPNSTSSDAGVSSLNGYFASGSTDNECDIKVFEYKKREKKSEVYEVATLKGHYGHIQSVSWSPHIKGRLISNSVDGSVQIWDVLSQSPLVTYTPIGMPVFSVWSPINPDFVLTGCKSSVLCVWEIKGQKDKVFPSSIEKLKRHKKDKDFSFPVTSKQITSVPEKKDDVKNNIPDTLKVAETKSVIKTSRETKMFSKVWKSEDLKTCYCLLKNRTAENENGFSLPFLCDEEYFERAIMEEEAIHKKANNFNEFVQLSLWRGNIKEVLEEKISNGQLNDFLVSLAPFISPRHWQEACLSYSKSLIEKKFYRKAASYLIACHKIYEAIDVLMNANLFLEALCICKSRLPKSDPILEEIIRKYAEWLFKNGSFLKACECYIFLGDYLEVAKICGKKGQAEYLSLAALAAKKSERVDLEIVEATNAIFKCLETKNYVLAQEICANHSTLKYLTLFVFIHKTLNELISGKLVLTKDILSHIKDHYKTENITFPESLPKLFQNYTVYKQKEQVFLIITLELSYAVCEKDPDKIATHVAKALSTCNRYNTGESGEIDILYSFCYWLSPKSLLSPDSYFRSETNKCSISKLKTLRTFLGTAIVRYLCYCEKSEEDLKLFDDLINLKDELLDEESYRYFQNLIEMELAEGRLLRNRLGLAKKSTNTGKPEKCETREKCEECVPSSINDTKNKDINPESGSELQEGPEESIKLLYVRNKLALNFKKLWADECRINVKQTTEKNDSLEAECSSLEEKVANDLNLLKKIKTEVENFEESRVTSPNPVPVYFMLKKICESLPENNSACILLNYLNRKWAALNS